MEWQNWALVVVLYVVTPFFIVAISVAHGREFRNEKSVVFICTLTALFGMAMAYAPARFTESMPVFHDDFKYNQERQPESRESLLQQREYLEARLWELQAEREKQ